MKNILCLFGRLSAPGAVRKTVYIPSGIPVPEMLQPLWIYRSLFDARSSTLVLRSRHRLLHYRMLPSMSRPANRYDNATRESFLRT
jgi:hypothetical protein